MPEFMRVPFGFPSLATRPMANSGGCPRSLRWSHGGPLGESWAASLPRGWNRAYSFGRTSSGKRCGFESLRLWFVEQTPVLEDVLAQQGR